MHWKGTGESNSKDAFLDKERRRKGREEEEMEGEGKEEGREEEGMGGKGRKKRWFSFQVFPM